MKTTFLLLNFIFYTFHTFAQENVFKNRILPRCNTVRNQSVQLRTEAAKVSLDSVVSIESKVVYGYDVNGFINSQVIYSKMNIQKIWENSYKYEFINDENRNVLIFDVYTWNETINQWVNFSKTESEFDVKGNQTLNVSYYWDKTKNEWVGTSKSETSYDLSNKTTLIISYNWNKSIKRWEESNKYTYLYDNYGNISQNSSTNWDLNLNKWSEASTFWIYENTLDSNYMPIIIIEYIDVNGIKSKKEKSDYAYDAYGNQILVIEYNWNFTLSFWEPSSKEENLFDESGNKIMNAKYDWNRTSNTWEGSYKEIYAFDNSVFASSLTTAYIGNDFKNKVTSLVTYNWSNDNWVESSNSKFYYSNDPTAIEDETFIASQKNLVRIYNQLGMEVKPEQVMNGLYIYHYSDGSTMKVIRQE